MSKEYLDELNRLGAIRKFDGGDNYSLSDKKEFKTVKQALQRLEAIDNANPSKALKYLDIIKHLEIGFDKNGNPVNVGMCSGFNTIKQTLLKAQEPKKYLKWEDLEFKIENQEMFVLLNGSYYLLEYYTDSEEEFVFIKATHTTVFELLGERSVDKQFFNDLHLERVE